MKNKFLSFILTFCLVVPCSFMLSACAEHNHTFAETWSYNDTHHWHASICGHDEEKADYAEHVDEDSDDVCDVCNHGAVALIGTKGYNSLEGAIQAAELEETVVLNSDIDLPTAIEIYKKVTINLNNKKLSVSQDTEGNGVFWVRGGHLTINGEGEVNGVGNNPWNIVIFAEGGEVTINGGTYTNVGAVDDVTGDDQHFDVIYAKGESKITVNGGTFMGETPKWILNVHNASRETSQIIVNGGTFHGFNPANNEEVGEYKSYVAECHEVQENTYQIVMTYPMYLNSCFLILQGRYYKISRLLSLLLLIASYIYY